MNRIPEKNWVIAGLSITGIILVILAFTTGLAAGGADNYAHFNIARWAFRYPHLFLDHWGKPLYTILAAPFAQLGFVAVRILNSILGLLTAWYVWKLANRLNFEYSWFAAVVAVFTPIYFAMMPTGMTEILFSLILVVSIYLFFKEKFILSAIFISFIFLARTEGLAFELLFFFGFLLKKQFKPIPFLATGFLLFSSIGWIFYYHDFWWLITQRPYATEGTTVYGHGTWDHYFKSMPNYLGIWVMILLAGGTISLVWKFVTERLKLSDSFLQILLILGTFWGYFFIHSYLWWKGETSAGLQRVMAGVSPLIGLIALNMFQFKVKSNLLNYFKVGLACVFSILIIINAKQFYSREVKYDLTVNVKNRVTEWLKESGSLNHKLVMHDPYYSFSTEIDAWDLNIVQYGFSYNDKPQWNLPDSTIFIWDAQFSANEGGLPFEKMVNNPNFEVIKVFEPEIPFKASADQDYRIVIFRIMQGKGPDNEAIIRELKNEQREKGIYHVENYDFEAAFSDSTKEIRRTPRADSTGFAYGLGNLEFSPEFAIDAEKLDPASKNEFYVSADFIKTDTIGINRLVLVFSVERYLKSEHYETRDIGEQIKKNGVWYKTDFNFSLPDNINRKSAIKIYVWNIDKQEVMMDNFMLEISKQTEN